MERRFQRNLSSESKRSSVSLQKQAVESRRQTARRPENAPDLTDFMNDMFFGTVSSDKKAYNFTAGGSSSGGFMDDNEREDNFDDSVRSNSGRSTQEWLEEAKRMVASSPSRCESPSRLVGSPRFAAAGPLSDRRDHLSRSARRHRGAESISGEILLKSAKHSRNKSEPFEQSPPPVADSSPASAVQKWFSDILKPSNPAPPNPVPDPNPTAPPLPPITPRRSRFQNQPQGIPTPLSRRTFRTTSPADGGAPGSPVAGTQVLSPPKNLIESAHRRSISSSTCSFPENQLLSPPKNLIESTHRRSISSTTCSKEKIAWRHSPNVPPEEVVDGGGSGGLNEFLKEQRIKIGKILNGEMNGKAKIVLSGPSNSTSSMVAAICYAWLLENKMKTDKEGIERKEGAGEEVVVPVMNMARGKMWKQHQVAWLFHHVGLDATALFFSDEVDLETLMMSKQLSILVVGQDILKTNGEVASQCTSLTDNYCEHAYDLLQTPILKKFMIAGILLDTQNLNMSGKLSMTRDSEAVQLLSVGSTPNYRNTLYDQLMQEQRDSSFFEVLRHNYGKSPNEGGRDNGAAPGQRIQERKSDLEEVTGKSDKNSNDMKNAKTNTTSPKSAKPVCVQAPTAAPAKKDDASHGKNKFFLAKWFGFGK